jgi:hypothetical protein
VVTHLKVCESDREIFLAIRLAEYKSVTVLPFSSRPALRGRAVEGSAVFAE